MDLGNVLKVKPDDGRVVEGVLAPWGEGEGGPEFRIAYLGRDVIKKARKKAASKGFNKTSHRFEETIDEDILGKEMMKAAVLGWVNLKVKHLRDILDPTKVDIPQDPKQMELDVEFNPSNLEFILEYHNIVFDRFVTSISMEAGVYQQYKEDEARKNSERSQSGKEAEVSLASNAQKQ